MATTTTMMTSPTLDATSDEVRGPIFQPSTSDNDSTAPTQDQPVTSRAAAVAIAAATPAPASTTTKPVKKGPKQPLADQPSKQRAERLAQAIPSADELTKASTKAGAADSADDDTASDAGSLTTEAGDQLQQPVKRVFVDLLQPVNEGNPDDADDKGDSPYVKAQKEACHDTLDHLKPTASDVDFFADLLGQWQADSINDREYWKRFYRRLGQIFKAVQFRNRDGETCSEYSASVESLFERHHANSNQQFNNTLKLGGRTWSRDWFYNKKWFQMAIVSYYRELTGHQKIYLNFDQDGRRYSRDEGFSGYWIRIVIS